MLAAARTLSAAGGSASGAFSDRHGGTSSGPWASLNLGLHTGDDPSAVAQNRARLAGALGLAPARVAFLEQVHGADVTVVRGPQDGVVPVADAAVTDVPGLALAVMVADCVPVLLLAPQAVGVAHAGRKGVQAGVVPAAVAALAGLGADPGDVRALLGPSVCGDCYEVPADLRDEVASVVPEAAASTRSGTPALDLPRAVERQLQQAGVARVERVHRCTVEDPDLFSHRGGDGGRQAGFAWRV